MFILKTVFKIQTICNLHPRIWNIINTIQCLQIIAYLITTTLTEYLNQQQQPLITSELIGIILYQSTFMFQSLLTISLLFFGLLCCLMGYFFVFSNWYYRQQYAKLLNMLEIILIIITILGELAVIRVVSIIAYFFKQQLIIIYPIWIVFIIICFCFVMFLTFLNYSYRLYSFYCIPIAVIISILGKWQAFIILITLSCYQIWQNHRHFQKFLYSEVIGIGLWSLVQFINSYYNGLNNNYLSSLIYLGLITVTILAINITQPFSKTPINSTLLRVCCKNQNNIPQSIYWTQIQFNQFMICYHQDHLKSPLESDAFESCVEFWPKQTIFEVLLTKFQNDAEKQNSSNKLAKLLKIQAMVRMGSDLTTVLKQIHDLTANTHKKPSIFDFQTYKRMLQIEQLIFKEQQNNHFEGAVKVLYLQQQLKQIYSNMSQTLQKLGNFWQNTLYNINHITQAMKMQLISINQHKQQLQYKLQALSQQIATPIQNNMQQMLKELVDSFYVTDNYSQQHSNSNKPSISLSFFIISQCKVLQASLKFLSQFEYTQQDLLDLPLNTIIPCNLQYLSNSCTTTKQQVYLPLVKKNGFMQIKKCNIYLMRNIFENVKYMYHLDNKFQSFSKPMLLYSQTQFTVVCINKKMQEYYLISEQKWKMRVSESKIMIREILNVNLQEQEKYQTMSSYDGLKAKLDTRLFSFLNKKIPVVLNLQHTYGQNHHKHSLISITHDSNRQQTQMNALKSAVVLENNQKVQQNKYQDQQFFCKITNPYNSTILEKNAALKESYRINNVIVIKILYFASLLMAGFSTALYYQFCINRANHAKQSYEQTHQFNQQYQSLMSAYYHLFISDHIKVQEHNIRLYLQQQLHLNYSQASMRYQQMINYHKKQKKDKLKTFSDIYLNKPVYSNIQVINYELKFKNFQIESNTQLSTLFDFLVEASNAQFFNSSLEFMITNLKSLVKIKPIFESNFQHVAEVQTSVQQFQLESSIVLGVTITIIILIYGLIYCILLANSQIKAIFTSMRIEDIQNSLEKVHKSQQLLKDSLQIMICQKSQQTSTQNKQQKQQLQNLQKSVKQICNLSSQNILKPQNQRNIEQQNNLNNIILQSKIRLLIRGILKYPFFIFFILLVFVSQIVQNIELEQTQAQIYKTVQLLSKLQASKTSISELFVMNLHNKLISHYNMNLPSLQHRLFQQQNTYFNLQYPQFNLSMLFNNLCQNKYMYKVKQPVLVLLKCQEVLSQIFKQGYPQSMQRYKHQLNNFVNVSNSTDRLLQLIFGQQLLDVVIDEVLLEFFVNSDEFIRNKSYNASIISLICSIIFMLTVVVYLYTILQLQKICLLGKSLFRIIPSEVMYRMTTTIFLRKYQVLNQLAYL